MLIKLAPLSLLFWHQKAQLFRVLLPCCAGHSSDQITRFQSFTFQCSYAFAHMRHCLACFHIKNECFTALHLRIPSSHSGHLIVYILASIFVRFFSSLEATQLSTFVLYESIGQHCWTVFVVCQDKEDF